MQIDLDEELLFHLAEPDSWRVLNREEVTDALITDPLVGRIFNWQRDYSRRHREIAPRVVLEDEFNIAWQKPEVPIEDLIDRLRARYARNQQQDRLKDIIRLQGNDPEAVPAAMMRYGRELQSVVGRRGEVFSSEDVEQALYLYHQQMLKGANLSLGFPLVNDYFYGVRGLVSVIGAPKSGKSWVMIQILLDNVLAGRSVDLYSLELPSFEADMRLRCLAANIPFWKFLRNALTPEDTEKLRLVSEALTESGRYRVIKTPSGQRGVDYLLHNSMDAETDVVLIDQLQYVEADDGINLGSHNQTGMYWNVLNKMRDYSDEIPIVYAHQFNRTAQNSDSMPSMEQAKGSGAIEETATLALGLWSDKDMRRLGLLEIAVLCARNHEYAAWEIQFERKRGCSLEVTQRIDLNDASG